jgi:hypothetical protein
MRLFCALILRRVSAAVLRLVPLSLGVSASMFTSGTSSLLRFVVLALGDVHCLDRVLMIVVPLLTGLL